MIVAVENDRHVMLLENVAEGPSYIEVRAVPAHAVRRTVEINDQPFRRVLLRLAQLLLQIFPLNRVVRGFSVKGDEKDVAVFEGIVFLVFRKVEEREVDEETFQDFITVILKEVSKYSQVTDSNGVAYFGGVTTGDNYVLEIEPPFEGDFP